MRHSQRFYPRIILRYIFEWYTNAEKQKITNALQEANNSKRYYHATNIESASYYALLILKPLRL